MIDFGTTFAIQFEQIFFKSKAKKQFMNPMILKTVAPLIDCNTDLKGQSVTAGTGSTRDFDSLLQNLNPAPKESFQAANPRSLPDAPFNKDRSDFYVESFRKALLAQGKPLNKVSLKAEDLALFKEFLCKCGFPPARIDQFLRDLLQNNPDGEINLSRFFQKITELGSPKSTKQPNNYLDPATVPHLEFILRNFGMTPGELERIFSAARAADGRLDLDKFVDKLKAITSRQNSKTSLTALQKLDHQLADKLKMLGIHIPEQNRSGQISLKDFIASLEKTVGRPDVEQKLPAAVKASMEQVLAKVVVSDGKAETTISKVRGGEPVDKEGLLSPLLDKVKPASESVLLAPFKEQSQQVAQKDLWPSLRDKNQPATQGNLLSSSKEAGQTGEHEKLPAFINERGGPDINKEQQSAVSANRAAKVGMLAKLDGGRDLKHAVKPESHTFKSETKVVNIHQQVTGSTLSEALDTIAQSQKPAQDFLPTYLVDQVGRQISRALLKADRVIRLQLKPPELGAVKIEMDIQDNVLRLEMITESSSVKELMLSNIHELKNALMEQGIKIEELDVQVKHDFNHSLANSEEGLKERQKFIQGQDRSTLTAENHLDDPESGLRNRASDDRLLNLVA